LVNIDKKLKLLMMIFLLGFISGLFFTITNDIKPNIINFIEISKVKIFINTFTMNIWIMLIVWLLNNVILNIIITFLKGLTEAICLISFLSSLNKVKMINFVSYTLYWLFMVPLFIWITYQVSYNLNKEQNFKKILISIFITIFFSLLIMIIN
jgi:hypothetical protein